MGRASAVAATFVGTYFEGNADKCDVWIDQGSYETSYVFDGCPFHRISGTTGLFCTNNILIEQGSGDGDVIVTLQGNGFKGWNTYTPDAGRPYIAISSVDGNYKVFDNGNLWQSDVEKPIFSPQPEHGSLELIETWTYSSDVTGVDFTDLGAYEEILIVLEGVTASAANARLSRVSTDNGSSFLSTSGDYVTGTDGVVAQTFAGITNTGTVSAVYAWQKISAFNKAGIMKPFEGSALSSAARGIIKTTSALNAIRVYLNTSGNLTGGSIKIYGQRG